MVVLTEKERERERENTQLAAFKWDCITRGHCVPVYQTFSRLKTPEGSLT